MCRSERARSRATRYTVKYYHDSKYVCICYFSITTHPALRPSPSLSNLSTISDGKVLGLFTASHLSYDHDRLTEGEGDEPSIMEMTKAAIDFLSTNHDGYYLMVEAGRVDHATHAGNMHRT